MSFSSLPSESEWGYQTQQVSPDDLVAALSAAVEAALRDFNALPDGPEPCEDSDGYFRASVEIVLPELLADQLMNGPTGYRAHYSISVETGERFNRELVDAAAPLIIEAEDRYRSKFCRQFCCRSLLGRFSKFWYPKQLTDPSFQGNFQNLPEVIRHPTWVNYWSTRQEPRKGLLAPISNPSSILLIGTFVSEDGTDYEQKLERSRQLFESGWT